MDRFLRGVFKVKDAKARYDDDFIDRLSRRYTASLFLAFSVVVVTTQYVGSPIHCWCPAEFTDSHKKYTDSVCWVSNTYYVPWDEDLQAANMTNEKMISYYQWVPFILLCQALMCYVPSMIWKFLCRRSGMNVSNIMDAAIAGQRTTYADIREKTVKFTVRQIERYLLARVEHKRGVCWKFKHAAAKYCCVVYGKFYGNYLSFSYIVIKALYVANAIGQLYMLDVFLGTNYHLYGVDVILRFIYGDDWSLSVRFPRVTICDFQVRRQGELHKYKVQCVLPINLFNEKIFIFIWFWLVMVAAMTCYSFLEWLFKSMFWPSQIAYVKRTLKSMDAKSRHKTVVSKFTQNYLRRDGMFLIRLLSNNVGSLAAAEVLNGLWESYGPPDPSRSATPGESKTKPRETKVLDGASLLQRIQRMDSV